jgi:hypothetical protein
MDDAFSKCFEKLYIANNLERDGKDIFYFGFTQGRLDEEFKKLNESLDLNLDAPGYFELVKAYWLPSDGMQLTNIKKKFIKTFHNKNIFKKNYFKCNPNLVIKKVEKEIKPLGAIDCKVYKVTDFVSKHLRRFIRTDSEEEPYVFPFYYTYDNRKLILERLITKLMECTSKEFMIDPEVIIVHEMGLANNSELSDELDTVLDGELYGELENEYENEGENELHTGLIQIYFNDVGDYSEFAVFHDYCYTPGVIFDRDDDFKKSCKTPMTEQTNMHVPNFCNLFITYLSEYNGDFISYLSNFGKLSGIAIDTTFYNEDTDSYDSYDDSDLDEDWCDDDLGDNHVRYYDSPNFTSGSKIRIHFHSILHALVFQATCIMRNNEYPKIFLAGINHRLEIGTAYENNVAWVLPEDGETYNNKLKLKWLGIVQPIMRPHKRLKLTQISKQLNPLMKDLMEST